MELKGSYTVEAAIVISFCLMLVAMAICISYELFQETLSHVSYKESDFDAVLLFRIKEGALEALKALEK